MLECDSEKELCLGQGIVFPVQEFKGKKKTSKCSDVPLCTETCCKGEPSLRPQNSAWTKLAGKLTVSSTPFGSQRGVGRLVPRVPRLWVSEGHSDCDSSGSGTGTHS